MSPRVACAAALLALPLASSARAGQEEVGAEGVSPPATWHARVVARVGDAFDVAHLWSKGPYLRSETVQDGHKIVTIVKGEFYYAYDVVMRKGLAIRRAAAAIAADSPERRPFGREFEVLVHQGAEKVRDDVLLGLPCDVYRVTDRHGRREIWVSQGEHRLPLRIEVYHRSASSTSYIDYMSWLWGLELPDSFFEPESGIEFEQFDLAGYLKQNAEQGYEAPAPIIYADLLTGKSRE